MIEKCTRHFGSSPISNWAKKSRRKSRQRKKLTEIIHEENPLKISTNSIPSFTVYTDELISSSATDSFIKKLEWHEAWIDQHQRGNKLPRGKRFNPARPIYESKTSSRKLGQAIIGSIRAALTLGELPQLKPYQAELGSIGKDEGAAIMANTGIKLKFVEQVNSERKH